MSWKVAATAAAALMLFHAGTAAAMDVGTMAEVRQNVYGVAPAGGEAVKRKGDAVVFQETLETLTDSGALIRFIDDSKLSLGAKSKVVIDAFVFDPNQVKGNALIDISVGTLRFVTGDMPKGGVVIKTPTATLVLRGTDVVVHVHPDGTTDTTVHEGKVEALNTVTNQLTNLIPGEGATLGAGGTTRYENDGNPGDGFQTGNDANDSPPEHRRSESPRTNRAEQSGGADAGAGAGAGADAGNGDDGSGDSDSGCGCI